MLAAFEIKLEIFQSYISRVEARLERLRVKNDRNIAFVFIFSLIVRNTMFQRDPKIFCVLIETRKPHNISVKKNSASQNIDYLPPTQKKTIATFDFVWRSELETNMKQNNKTCLMAALQNEQQSILWDILCTIAMIVDITGR